MFRALSTIRTVAKIAVSGAKRPVIQQTRLSSDAKWTYRNVKTDVPKGNIIKAEVIMGVMWYWILFHLWYDFGHITGHFEYPDPSKWTDKELGIPPLSED